MCAEFTRRNLLRTAGTVWSSFAGVATAVGSSDAAVADDERVGADTDRSPDGGTATTSTTAFEVDGETFHADGETFVSAWTHEQVGHASAFEAVMDHGIATLMEFDHWNCRRLRGLDGTPSHYQDIVDAGYVPHVVWNGPHSVENGKPWPRGTPPASAYQQGGARYGQFCADVAAGRLDDKLRAIAARFAAVDGPILFCPWEEANGTWRPAIGTRQNGPGMWAAAWRHMVEVFRSAGADNVAWVLAPSGNVMRDHRIGDANGLDRWYPGDAYVDYVGTDFYDHAGKFHSQGTPAEIFDDLLGQFNRVTAERKPYIQNEIGVHTAGRNRVVELSAQEWTARALRAIRDREQIVGFLWWDMAAEGLSVTGQDWDTEPASLTEVGRAFRDVLQDGGFVDSFALGTDTGGDGTFVDDCDSLLHAHSTSDTKRLTVDASNARYFRRGDQCSIDGGRIARSGTTEAVDLVYAPRGTISGFTVTFHSHLRRGGDVTFAVSTDRGESWLTVSPTTTTGCAERGGWRQSVFESDWLPTGTDRLRLRLVGGTVPWSGQLSTVRIETTDGLFRGRRAL